MSEASASDDRRSATGENGEAPIVVCSLGDASVTEGEVSEAFQFAVLKKLPIIYQDRLVFSTSQSGQRMKTC